MATLGSVVQWTVSNEDVFVRLDPGDEIHTSCESADPLDLMLLL